MQDRGCSAAGGTGDVQERSVAWESLSWRWGEQLATTLVPVEVGGEFGWSGVWAPK